MIPIIVGYYITFTEQFIKNENNLCKKKKKTIFDITIIKSKNTN